MKSVLKITAVAAAALGLLCANNVLASSGEYEGSASDSNFVAVAGGTALLPVGDLVEAGSFTLSNTAIQGLTSGNTITPANEATLLAAFVPENTISSGTISEGTGGAYAGAFDIDFYGNNMGSSVPAYILIFNASTSGAATQVGVFNGAAYTTVGSWTFPVTPSSSYSGGDFDDAHALIGTYTTNSALDVPYNDGPGGQNPVINTFNLDQIVPEPSTYMLVAMGLLGGIGLIRRRRS